MKKNPGYKWCFYNLLHYQQNIFEEFKLWMGFILMLLTVRHPSKISFHLESSTMWNFSPLLARKKTQLK